MILILFKLNTAEQIRVERIPLVLQTTVHTTYTTVPFRTGRETRTLKKQILNLPRIPFRHSCILVEVVGIEPTPYLNNRFTVCPNPPTLAYFLTLSEKQDSNLRPPASKADKQPPLSSQF